MRHLLAQYPWAKQFLDVKKVDIQPLVYPSLLALYPLFDRVEHPMVTECYEGHQMGTIHVGRFI